MRQKCSRSDDPNFCQRCLGRKIKKPEENIICEFGFVKGTSKLRFFELDISHHITVCPGHRGKKAASSQAPPCVGPSLSPAILFDPSSHYKEESDPTREEIAAYALKLVWNLNEARGEEEQNAAEKRREAISRPEYIKSLEAIIKLSESAEVKGDEHTNVSSMLTDVKGKGKAKAMDSSSSSQSSDDELDDDHDDVLMDYA